MNPYLLSFFIKGLFLLPALSFMLNNPASYNHKTLVSNNHTYHYVDEGSQDAPLLIICHGFPESWFMYKHQIKHFSQMGYRVIALDMLGYGESDAPEDLLEYTYGNLTLGLKGFVYELGHESAVFMGHDWGSVIIWQLALAYPEVVNSIISLCVPFLGPIKYTPQEILKNIPSLNYLFSITLSKVETMDENRNMFIKSFLSKDPNTLKAISRVPAFEDFTDSLKKIVIDRTPVISEEDTNYLLDKFSAHGLRGPTNYYRNLRTNQVYFKEAIKPVFANKLEVPVLFIKATEDMINEFGNDNDEYIKNVTTKVVNGGHWIHITHRDEVNNLIQNWLETEEFVFKPKRN